MKLVRYEQERARPGVSEGRRERAHEGREVVRERGREEARRREGEEARQGPAHGTDSGAPPPTRLRPTFR